MDEIESLEQLRHLVADIQLAAKQLVDILTTAEEHRDDMDGRIPGGLEMMISPQALDTDLKLVRSWPLVTVNRHLED